LLVKGFAVIRCYGSATILGVDVSNKSIKIRENKILPIESNDKCRISITLGRCGKYYIKNREEIGTSIWDDIRDAVYFKDPDRIIIVGANDTGKSTLAVYLANLLKKAYVIDGDVGQGDLAPPACIGASMVNNNVLDLDLVKADLYSFIGSITPSPLVVDAIKKMYKNDPVIINTDGYIDKYGLAYKIKLVDIIKPDMIICLGNDDYSKIFLKKYKNVYLADKPRYVEKAPRDRLFNRLRRYKRFIGYGERYFYASDKKIWLFNKFYDLFIKNDYIILEPFGPMLPISTLKDMYVALNMDDYVVGFGVIRATDKKILLQTSYEGEFNTVMLSNIKLSKDLNNEYKIRYTL
jgi:polynucleotide 5'-hydroxyl-kinase GRC3/NOL9